HEMLLQFIEDNNVDAEIVSDEKYPQYADSVVIEFNMKTSANTEILKFAEAENIERTCFNLVPCENKVAITTVNPDTETITTITTTVENNTAEELPQTGMPYARAVEGIAALLTLGGAALIVKSRKENDET
ncbi:MAG: LPXTG cell wall anchor domain-containing protein, partial [Oscillospiraceae bacterium]|nr:LPXTG cell wall anchor domain-containing protein [Oscillospiraceae bacterium]